MGIFPWFWSVETTRTFWLIILCMIGAIAFILLSSFLFPRSLKRTRQKLDLLMSTTSEPKEWVDRAFTTLQQHGHVHITREQILTLSDDDIQRLDQDSATDVTAAQFAVARDKSMAAHKKFLERQTWWSYRVYIWRELNRRQVLVTSLGALTITVGTAYVYAVLTTLEAAGR